MFYQNTITWQLAIRFWQKDLDGSLVGFYVIKDVQGRVCMWNLYIFLSSKANTATNF